MQLAFMPRIPSWMQNTEYWTPAARANALCCILGGLTGGFISLSVFFATNHFTRYSSSKSIVVPSSVSAAIIHGASALTWEYSVGAEVFALNNTLSSALLCLTCWYSVVQSDFILAAGAAVAGLGLTNQHTIGTTS